MRRTPALALAALTAAATALSLTATPAATGAAAGDRYGTVWNILPPGQSGTVNAVDLVQVLAGDPQGRTAVEGENAPENFADQLEMYDALTRKRPGALTRADLDRLYKHEDFTPEQVVSTETPRPGVTIRRDQYGVPYIHGKTFEDVEFGAGYAGTQDRTFLMDVLRHAGKARLAEFAGATPANLEMDRQQLRSAYYTPQEAAAQVERAAKRYGGYGEKLLGAVDAFVAGINAAQDAMCPGGLPTGPDCPAEYAALQKTPQPWTRADVVYVASLVGGIFGKGGGHEYQNAIWLQRLMKKYGVRRGKAIYDDLREKDDPDAPTTATVRTPYGGSDRVHPGRPGVALPGLAGLPGIGDLPDLPGLPGAGLEDLQIDLPNGTIDVPVTPHGMSNAILVAGEHTRSGKPLAVMGPQTGYYTPQLLTEEVLVGPGIRARGVAFAGTQLFVQLGRGVDYAWSATSASNDLVDTVVVRLCNTDGSRPTVHSVAYRDHGRCVPMDRFEHTENTVPSLAYQGAPKTYTFLVLRTRQGMVQLRTTVDSVPVAIVSRRSTYGHEVDSVVGFALLNDPGYVHDARSFQRAASHIDYTFNWFYVDDRDISYYSSGLLPIRSGLVDYDLPHWAGKRYAWQGWLPARRHVHQTDPGRGYLISWNNKTAPGFAAADDVWGYGTVYRSLALEDHLKHAIRHGRKVGIADVVGVMSAAATEDSRARYTLPWLLKAIGKDHRTAPARRVLRAWLRDGAQRVDRDRDGHYAHEQAIALFDAWWEDGEQSVAYDVMRGRLGRLVRKLPAALDDHPRIGRGSAWNDVAWYGYLNKDLRDLLGHRFQQPYRFGYCGRGRLAACRADLRRSLRRAVSRVLGTQGVSSVRDLTYDKTQDDIRSVTAGVVGVRPIDWQNRPTFQQVVAFTGHR